MTTKREEVLSWDGYFMSLAMMASFRSKDPSTQNGCCIIDIESKNILSMGYNGVPRGCSDDEFPWNREGNEVDTKYPYVEHAERNAIYNAVRNGIKLNNSALYLYSEKGLYPCKDCARAIIQSGIKSVTMLFCEKTPDIKWDYNATLRMFKSVPIRVNIMHGDDLQINMEKQTIKDMLLISSKMSDINKKLSEGV